MHALALRAKNWRLRPPALLRAERPLLLAAAALAVLLLLLSPLALAGKALFGGGAEALSAAFFVHSVAQTALYAGGVAALCLLFALPAACATVFLNFRGRRLAVWLLLLPFALPPYITGYVVADFLRIAGLPAGGLGMACLATALALYPYVYFMARAALRRQCCHIQSAARLLGYSPWSAFWRVSFPLARPAVAVGVALAVMECLNDIAIAEFYGVNTLGAGVYDLWLNRNDATGAARLALALLLAAYFLSRAEEAGRRKQRQYAAAVDKRYDCERAAWLTGARAWALRAALALPPLAGFFAPAAYLLYLAAKTPPALWLQALAGGFAGSALLALAATALLLAFGLLLALNKRHNGEGFVALRAARLARVAYAMPGAALAQGAFLAGAAAAALFGGGALLIGGFALLLLAVCSRFFAIAGGAVESGMAGISPRLDSAAKMAAMGPARLFVAVHLPLLRPALALAAVMLFLECVKELPMVMLLRPLNFNTLSTVVYQYASDEALGQAAPAALLLAALAACAITLLFFLEGRDSRGNA